MRYSYHLTPIPDTALHMAVRAYRNGEPGLWNAPDFWSLPALHTAFLLTGRQVEAAEARFSQNHNQSISLLPRLWWRWGMLARALHAFGAPLSVPPHRVEVEMQGDVPLIAHCWTCNRHLKKQAASDGIPLPIWLLEVRAFTAVHSTQWEAQP